MLPIRLALALATGIAAYFISEPLGWIAVMIGLGSAITILACRRPPHETPPARNLRIVFLICTLFSIAGFTYIAYPSAPRAYDYYGDFHAGGAADGDYANAIIKPWHAAPPLGLFFAEGKIAKTVIDLVHPPSSEIDSRANAVEAIIFLNIANRLLALIVFMMMLRGASVMPIGAVAALLIFSFQYTNIGLTQSMKFVAGIPFFMLWIASFLRYEATRSRRALALHIACLVRLLFSQQWILFFVAAFYLLHPAFRYAAGDALARFDTLGALGVALASAALYVAERSRFLHGDIPLIPIVPSAFRSPFLAEYPLMLVFALAAIAIGICIYRRTTPFSGSAFLALLIIPLAIVSRSLIFLHPSVFSDLHFIAFADSYWLLVSLALCAVARNAFRDRTIGHLSLFALFAWFASALPQLLLICGVSIPTSPVLDVIVTPLLVLAAGMRPSRAFIAIFALVLITIPLSSYRLIAYASAWDRILILIPVLLAPLALMLAEKYRHA